jgi:hypothetical protein
MTIVNMRGRDEAAQRRYFMKMLVVHPKVVILRAALGEDVDVDLFQWAISEVERNERCYVRFGLSLNGSGSFCAALGELLAVPSGGAEWWQSRLTIKRSKVTPYSEITFFAPQAIFLRSRVEM